MCAEKRDRRIEVRVSKEEAQEIRDRARLASLTLTEYIVRRCALDEIHFKIDRLPGVEANRGDAERLEGDDHGRHAGAKTEIIQARCTKDERERIENNARQAKLKRSDYLIASALGNIFRPIVWDGVDDLRAVYSELRAQGRNLNQISYGINWLKAIAWIDDIDANLLNELLRGIVEDNERTRALINDAISETTATLRRINDSRSVR